MGLGARELRCELYKAYFRGDFKDLRVFREIMSSKAFKRLAKLDSRDMNHVEIMLLLDDCGLNSDEYQEKYDRVMNGRELDFFEYHVKITIDRYHR